METFHAKKVNFSAMEVNAEPEMANVGLRLTRSPRLNGRYPPDGFSLSVYCGNSCLHCLLSLSLSLPWGNLLSHRHLTNREIPVNIIYCLTRPKRNLLADAITIPLPICREIPAVEEATVICGKPAFGGNDAFILQFHWKRPTHLFQRLWRRGGEH